MQTTPTPDASRVLLYDPPFLSTQSGLWLCTCAEDVYAIGVNAATLQAGASFSDLAAATPFFEAFPYVLVVGANEAQRTALADALRRYVPSVCKWITPQSSYCGCDSIAELLQACGREAVDSLETSAEELPPFGLLEVSTIEDVDLSRQPHSRSGIPDLDRMIGGLYDGELSIWTGKRKEGKSTMVGIPILSAIKEGRTVFVYSGELPAWRYKAWLTAMAAGPDYVLERKTATGKTVWTPRPEIRSQIDIWWKDKLFIVDNKVSDLHKPENLLGIMRYAHMRYRCSIFVIDNLMTVSLPGENKYDAQSAFVGSLVDFAHETNAHVHLVAHKRKSSAEKKRGDSDDVSGSSEITNRADNLFGVSRVNDENSPYDAQLEVILNRGYGETGFINLKFDPRSRRYYSQNPNWPCGWESVPQQFIELKNDDPNNPFI